MRVYGLVSDKRRKNGSAEQILRALNGRLSQAAINSLLFSKGDRTGAANESSARLAFTLSFRLLVDAWIDSAKTKDGEQPWKRVFPLPYLQDYLDRNPLHLNVGEEGPYLVLLPNVWPKPKQPSAFIWEALTVELRKQVGDEKARFEQFMLEVMPFAWDAAVAMLLQLLDSSERTRLFHCDGCGTYFMRARTPKRDVLIYRGSWCVRCKGKGAAARTEESRKIRTKQMVEWAADAWTEWRPNQPQKYGERAEWVAQRVNKRLPADWSEIARNWVTHHQDEIEAEVERRRANG